jgi:hypothetical protein
MGGVREADSRLPAEDAAARYTLARHSLNTVISVLAARIHGAPNEAAAAELHSEQNKYRDMRDALDPDDASTIEKTLSEVPPLIERLRSADDQ